MKHAGSPSISVLLIEDNAGDATLIETYLDRADTSLLGSDVELIHEERLDSGLDRLESRGIDVALLDLGLSESTGLDTLERVLETDPDAPVVVLTGLDDQSTAIEAIQKGAQDYLTKDRLDGALLVRTIRYAIERTTTRRELQRQNERLERFASVLSHDLRNPLNVAKGRLKLVRRECDDENGHLAEIASMHGRMEQLIADVLTLARQGQSIGETEPVTVGTVARQAWETAGAERATLRIEGEFDVRADPERLRTMLENLFKNAVRHVGEDVTVTVGPLPDRDGFHVTDDGPGIPEKERESVFEPGYTTASEGTGFGLHIVKEISDAHGWTVELADHSDGTRFEFVGQAGTSR